MRGSDYDEWTGITMAKKKIRGTVNTTLLEAGEVAEVEYTDQVKGLIDNGYAELADDDNGGKDNGKNLKSVPEGEG